MTTTFHSVKISEISCFLLKKLQLFEAHSLHITDCAQGVEADKPDIAVDEEEDQAESGSLYTSPTETETETETNPKG